MTDPLEDFSLFAKRWLPALIWMGVILFASTDVGSTSNSYRLIRPWLLRINPKMTEPEVYRINLRLRKTMHVLQFAILAVLVLRAHRMLKLPPKNRNIRAIGFVFFIAIVFAAGSEGIQYFMKSRGASIKDVFLDLGGTTLGLLVAYLAGLFKKRPAIPLSVPRSP